MRYDQQIYSTHSKQAKFSYAQCRKQTFETDCKEYSKLPFPGKATQTTKLSD